MSDQLDDAKDITIAFLTTSGLLVTLLAGFTLSTGASSHVMSVKTFAGAVLFLITAIMSSITLFVILMSSEFDRKVICLMVIQTLAFVAGIAFLIGFLQSYFT